MQAISAIGALTTSSHSQRTWASAVPPSSGPRMKPDMPTTIITVMARMRSALSSKSRKTSELVIGAIAAAAMPSAARRAMSSPGGGDDDDAQAQQAEHGEPDQQHAPASEPVGDRSGGEQQAAEGQRVRAGDPLQRGRAAAEVAADRGQRDRQQRVVDHLDEEGQAERGQGDPRRAQRRVGARRRAWRRAGGRGHGPASATPLAARSHGAHTALASVSRGCEGRVAPGLLRGSAGADQPGAAQAVEHLRRRQSGRDVPRVGFPAHLQSEPVALVAPVEVGFHQVNAPLLVIPAANAPGRVPYSSPAADQRRRGRAGARSRRHGRPAQRTATPPAGQAGRPAGNARSARRCTPAAADRREASSRGSGSWATGTSATTDAAWSATAPPGLELLRSIASTYCGVRGSARDA